MRQRPVVTRNPVARIAAVLLALAAAACSKDEPKGASLQRVDVSPPTATVAVGLSTAFTATGVYSDGTSRDLTAEVLWTVEDGVAFFPGASPAGTALGLEAGGPAVVRAILLGSAVVGEAALTVTDAVPISVDVSPALATLAAGLTQPFAATAVLSDGSHLDVTAQAAWSSSAPGVASVSTDPATAGTVAALAIGGPVTITAALPAAGVQGTATVHVAAAAVAAIDVSPAAGSVAAGRTVAFTADAVLTDGTRVAATEDATWASADPGIAPVSNAAGSRGVVTGLRAGGPVALTVRLPGVAAVGAAAVEVTPAELVSLEISPAAAWLAAGTGTVLRATGVFSDGTHADLTGVAAWSSSEQAVAAVATGGAVGGQVTAVAPGGPVTITAAMPAGGPSASAQIHVTPAVLVALEVAPAAASQPLGRAQPFTATGRFSDGSSQDLTTQVSWLSSDVTVATVSNAAGSSGTAQSRAEGAADLIAWYPGTAVTAAGRLTVTPPELVSLALAPAAATIPAGRTQQFAAFGTFTDGVVRDVTAVAAWSSADAAVAAATGSPGQFRGAAEGGPVAVTAVASGVPASAQLTVGPAVLETVALTPASLALRWGESATIAAEGTWSDGTHRDVTAEAAWSAAPSGVVRLDLAGATLTVTGRGLGATVVSATLAGVTGTADASVEPLLPDSIVVVPGAGVAATGAEIRFRAWATYPGGAVVDVSGDAVWTATDPLVAVPKEPAGTFLALAAGTTGVTATLGVSGSASLEVSDTPPVATLAALRIEGSEPPLGVGGAARLRALGTWSDGGEEDLTAAVAWSSDDEGVLTVDPSGLAEAHGEGAVTVTALHVPSSVAAQAAVEVLPERPVEALVIRGPPRIVEGQWVPVAAIGLLAGGGEVDLTAAAQWAPIAAGTMVSTGSLQGAVPRAAVAAVYGGLVATFEADVVPLSAARRLEILPGDATLVVADLTLDGTMFVPFLSVLTFDDAWPRQVNAGACGTSADGTDDPDGMLLCALALMETGQVMPGCELPCYPGPGVSLCLPLAPTVKEMTCSVGSLSATASVAVVDRPVNPAPAGLLIRPAGWAAEPHVHLNPFTFDFGFSFAAELPSRFQPGDSAPLEAVAFFDDGSFFAVPATWSTTAPPVAWVEADGLLHARGPGEAAVQATAVERTATHELMVFPPAASTGLWIDGPGTVFDGDVGAFQAWRGSVADPSGPAFDATAEVVWISSDPGIASFDPAVPGRLVAHGAGELLVTARTRDGFAAQRPVRVVGLTELLLAPDPVVVAVNERDVYVSAWARLTDGTLQWVSDRATWTVDDPMVAWPLMDPPDGGFWPNDVGITTVRAEYRGLQASATFEVVSEPVPPTIASLLVVAPPPVAVGAVARPGIGCFMTDGTFCGVDGSFGFATDDPAVAAPLDGDPGAVLAIAAGTTPYTVTAPGGSPSASAPITVFEIAAIEVSPLAATVAVGEAVEFTAAAVDGLGGRHPLEAATWSSSDPAFAVPDDPALGWIRGLAEGSVTVTATAGALQGSATLVVEPARLLGLTVTPGSAPVELGAEIALGARAYFSDGTSLDVTGEATWTSLDEAVLAPVPAAPPGRFEALALGDTVVTASWGGAGAPAAAFASIRVKPPISEILVLLEIPVVPAGMETWAVAGAIFADGSIEEVTAFVTWSAEDPSVAEPIPGRPGAFRALAPGATAIVATSASGVSGQAPLEVTEPAPISITVSPPDADGTIWLETAFTATAEMSDGTLKDVTADVLWFVDGPAEVVAPGVILPQWSGDVLVTAWVGGVYGEVFGSAWLHVAPFVTQVMVEPPMADGFLGDTFQFSALAFYSDGTAEEVTGTALWSADRPEAVATGVPGEFRFDGSGAFEVRAEVGAGGAVGTASVWIQPVPLAITVSPNPAVVVEGDFLLFTAMAEMSDASFQDVTWEADWSVVDAGIGAFFGPGDFVATAPGTTEVVATWGAAGQPVLEGRASVEVLPIVVGVRVDAPPAPVYVGDPAAFTAWLEWSDGGSEDITGIAIWSANGPFQPLGPGAFVFDASAWYQVTAESATGHVGFTLVQAVPKPTQLDVLAPVPACVVGETLPLNAAVMFSDGGVSDETFGSSWSLDGPFIGTLGPGGLECGAPGTADVVAVWTDSWGTSVEGRLTVVVLPP